MVVGFSVHVLDDPDDELGGDGYVKSNALTGPLYCPEAWACVNIGSGWAQPYRHVRVGGLCLIRPRTRPTMGNVMAHELTGHVFEFYAYGVRGASQLSEMFTIRQTDHIYQAVRGMQQRCAH